MENQEQSIQSQVKKSQSQPAKQVKQSVDPAIYERFTHLYLIKESRAKLTDKILNEITALGETIQNCSGNIAKMTVTAAIKNEICKMIEGFPVTPEIEKIVKEAKADKYYFV